MVRDDARSLYFAQSTTKYWEYSHAPLIKMEGSDVTMTENIFTDNYCWQVDMKGSLFEFTSTVETTAVLDQVFIDTSTSAATEQTPIVQPTAGEGVPPDKTNDSKFDKD